MRYSAFISYNYADRRWATWLHRALESYRVPKRLRGHETPFGKLGDRLPPLFRDRDELAASSDLGSAVREALEQSAFLIVICSPNGARSRWVNEEIRTFRAMGRGDRIRCVIVDGDPHSADPAIECLPPALLEDGAQEPLAADVRPAQDGKAGARLKLLASLLDVPYDTLRQREAARRQRRLAIAAVVTTIIAAVMTALAIAAVISRDEARRQERLATERAITAERTVGFVKSLFEVSDPSEARGATITAREILDRGATQIRRDLGDEPAVRAELATTLGEVYSSLGLFRPADVLLGWAGTLPHGRNGIAARQLSVRGDVQRQLGNYERAASLYQKAIDLLAADPGPQPILARSLAGLAEAQSRTDAFEAADRNARRALALDEAARPSRPSDVARDLEVIGLNLYYQGELDKARPFIARALDLRLKREGPLSPSVSDDTLTLGSIAYAQGDGQAAERYFRSRLTIDEKVLGPRHPDIAATLNNLGRVLSERRAYAEALPLLRRATELNLAARGPLHDDMAFTFANLAMAERGLGRFDAAEADYRRGLLAARRNKHRTLGAILIDLAELRCRRGDTAGGLVLLAEAEAPIAETYADQPWRKAWLDNGRGACLVAMGERDAGLALLRSSVPAIETRWPGASHFGTLARERLAAATGR